MNIRIAKHNDQDGIREIHLDAFDDSEKEIVANLAINLLTESSTPQTITLVAEIDNTLVGHIAFSPVRFKKRKHFFGYILAPLAIKSEYQQKGIGSKLVEQGLQYLKHQGVSIAFVYGDPKYYSRFGFVAELAEKYTIPYNLQYPFGWQATILNHDDNIASSGSVEFVNPLCNPELW